MQYVILLLMAFAVPIRWRFGLWMTVLLVPITVIKILAQPRLGNPVLDRKSKVALLGPVIYWLMLALSLFWSDNITEGLDILGLKAVILIFPVCFLVSDTSYLTESRVRGIGYALISGLICISVYFLVFIRISNRNGVVYDDFHEYFDWVYHHSYMAMYSVVALVFIYHELSSHFRELNKWVRLFLALASLMIICCIILVNSRTGFLVAGISILVCGFHLIISHRSWKIGLLACIFVVAAIVAAIILMPGHANRFASAKVQDDPRIQINHAVWTIYQEHPVVGFGIGDYYDRQVAQYEEDGFGLGVEVGFNAHNQYMETLLSAGIPGLIALLFFLVTPFAVSIRSRHVFISTLLSCIVWLNLILESMLERQMGLIFIAYLFSLLILLSCSEKMSKEPI